MSPFYPDKFKDPPKESPGEKEIRQASTLLQLFRLFQVDMPLKEDEAAVHRAGVLLSRWWRKITLRKEKK